MHTLGELRRGTTATIARVADARAPDPIAERLRDLGFVPGETVRVIAEGPIGGDPLVVQIGHTRFALRRAEAARVLLGNGAAS